MKHSSLFRLPTMMIILFYCVALAQAGQVITDDKRVWAGKAVQQEQKLDIPAPPNSIGVLYFSNKSGRPNLDPLQKGMAVMLISDLAKVEEIQVVERIRMQALLDEMDLGASALMDAETAPRVGKLLGAYYLAGGDILKGREEELEIDPSLLDVPFEQVIEQPSAAGALEELFTLEKVILFNIIKELKIYISPEKEAELRKPLSTSIAALLALFLGIEHSDKGQYSDAANMYEQALIEDPNLKLAKSSLQELKDMGLAAAYEAPMLKEGPPPPEAVGGLTTVTKIGLGVGAVAAAVGIGYLAAENDSGSDSSTDTPAQPGGEDGPPAVLSVDPGEGGLLNCTNGSLSFSFSKPMMQSGEVLITAADTSLINFFSGQRWSGEQNFIVSWSHSGNNQFCYDDTYDTVTPIIITLSNFQDIGGYALSGIKNFSYDGKLFRHGSVEF